ncbi:hypothetical protein HKX48_003279 [Thoreauomyces humboldtii]|nr:hypothetical protein HKX48_003279 [Thoreauomyces humboldtii]
MVRCPAARKSRLYPHLNDRHCLPSFAEMLNNPLQNNVDGILFGTRERRTLEKTTDLSSTEKHEETTILVSSYVCTDPRRRFYDACGRIVGDVYEELVMGKQDSVIGMFKWRRNTKLSVSVREEAILSSLQESSPSTQHPYVLGLFTASSEDPAIFQFDFAFYRQDDQDPSCALKRVPTVVANLVESGQIQHEWFVGAAPSFASLPDSRLAPRMRQLSQRYVQDHVEFFEDSLLILKDAAERLAWSERELRMLRGEGISTSSAPPPRSVVDNGRGDIVSSVTTSTSNEKETTETPRKEAKKEEFTLISLLD